MNQLSECDVKNDGLPKLLRAIASDIDYGITDGYHIDVIHDTIIPRIEELENV